MRRSVNAKMADCSDLIVGLRPDDHFDSKLQCVVLQD